MSNDDRKSLPLQRATPPWQCRRDGGSDEDHLGLVSRTASLDLVLNLSVRLPPLEVLRYKRTAAARLE